MGPFKITFAAFIAGPLASISAPGEDPDERKTLSDLWKEGDEEADSDWLSGTGLKFHTTADKAFAMDSKRFKDISQNTGAAENREAVAVQAKKRSEIRMREVMNR